MASESQNVPSPILLDDAVLSSESKGFFPSGALVFFVGLIAFFALVWFWLYALMIYRH